MSVCWSFRDSVHEVKLPYLVFPETWLLCEHDLWPNLVMWHRHLNLSCLYNQTHLGNPVMANDVSAGELIRALLFFPFFVYTFLFSLLVVEYVGWHKIIWLIGWTLNHWALFPFRWRFKCSALASRSCDLHVIVEYCFCTISHTFNIVIVFKMSKSVFIKQICTKRNYKVPFIHPLKM